jgi:uncharacterized protein (TIGR03663 family)
MAGALAFRLPKLDMRPLHGDEANQAYKAGILIERGEYRYDPIEHHGPTLPYLALPVAWLSSIHTFEDMTEFSIRIVPVLFGAGLILLLLGTTDGLGRAPALCAAVLIAISPALVFYSRYYIQETLLVFFAFAAIVAGWRYTQRPRWTWAILTGASAGLMHATKETCILSFAAMAGGLLLTMGWTRLRDGQRVGPGPLLTKGSPEQRRALLHLVVCVVAAVVVSVALFSSFFTNAGGPLDSILTYGTYLGRASNENAKGIHDKPWDYFLEVLTYIRTSSGTWWSEGLIVGLAVVGAIAALAQRGKPGSGIGLARFLAFYTVLLTAAYSLIPYKTPWCLINFLHPMTLLAGLGAVALVRWARFLPVRVVVALALAAGAGQLGYKAYEANYVVYSDVRNPYVYAHPVIAFKRLPRRAEELAQVHPDGHDMVIKVIVPSGDYWPLPWYLRKFNHVGYFHEIPEGMDAPLVIVSRDVEPLVAHRLKDAYQPEFCALRRGVLLKLFIEQGLWDAFMATRM